MPKLITPIWKQIKTLAPHCPICQEQWFGNGSSFFPYKCSCTGTGHWEYERREEVDGKIISTRNSGYKKVKN